VPRPAGLVRVAGEPHRRHRERTHRADDEVAVVAVGAGGAVARVLAGRVLPASVGRSGVRQQERAQRPVREPERDRRGVLDRKAARRVGREGLDRDDLAGERAQVVDLVDHVEQDRPAAGFATPGVRAVEIAFVLRLVEHRGAADRDQPPEGSTAHRLHRLRHDRAVPAVVADEDRDAGGFGGLAHPDTGIERVRDRLLDQGRQPRRDAFERVLQMELIGRGEDHAVGAVAGYQFIERPVERHRVRAR